MTTQETGKIINYSNLSITLTYSLHQNISTLKNYLLPELMTLLIHEEMMARALYAVLAFFALLGTGAPAQAQDYLVLNAGYFDIWRQKDPAVLFGAEYRLNPLLYGIGPMAGGFVTSKGSSYVYAGLDWDIPLIEKKLYVVPYFAPGWYSAGGGKRLGGPLSFHVGVEMDYQFHNAQRLGISFNHNSNAGTYFHNQSDENLLIVYAIPIRTIGRWMGL